MIVVVVILCAISLVRPFAGLLAYFWFGLMRPDILAYASGAQPLSFALAVVLIISSTRAWCRVPRLFLNPIVCGLFVMQFAILLSVVFAVDPSLSFGPYWAYLRVLSVPLLIPVLVQSVEDLRKLLLLIAMSLGVVGIKFGLWGLEAGGAVFTNGYGGMLSDNNDMGLAFVMTVALCWYCRELVTSRWAKMLFLLTAFATATAAVMTHSRGAALSMTGVLCFVVTRSKRKLLNLVLAALLVGPAVYLVRDSYFNRLSTIETYREDSSAMGRIENAKAAFAMWKDYPLFGVGFGMDNFVRLSEQYGGRAGLVVHDTYVQTLVDDGIIATATYVGLLFGTIVWLGLSGRRVKRVAPRLSVYPVAIQTALIAFSVGSIFLSRLQFDLLYILLMCAAAWHPIGKSLLASAEKAESDEISSHQQVGMSYA